MNDSLSEWTRKGATFSHKTVQAEFGLTYEEIARAIRAGTLQYRESSIYGNPILRLLRREVESLVGRTRGEKYLKQKQAKTELVGIQRELKRLRARIVTLETRSASLVAKIEK